MMPEEVEVLHGVNASEVATRSQGPAMAPERGEVLSEADGNVFETVAVNHGEGEVAEGAWESWRSCGVWGGGGGCGSGNGCSG